MTTPTAGPVPHHFRQTTLAALAAAAIAAASCRQSQTATATDAGNVSDLLDPAFAFRCSPQRAIGCRNVFGPRLRAGVDGGPTGALAALQTDGEAALAFRLQSLQAARRSIRIQALIFSGDETGLAVAKLLKQKRQQGLDVRVIVDAASNLDLHAQWMYFDLKQHGIAVEGYEALYLQWVAAEVAPTDPLRGNKRFHDKMWVVDAEEPAAALAIVGGRNVANEYFRVDRTPLNRWRDQDMVLRGPIVQDVTAAFDTDFEWCKEQKSKLPAAFNPDNSWRLTRALLDQVGQVKVPTWSRPELAAAVDALASRPLAPAYASIDARFVQSRPRFDESYIWQSYRWLFAQARSELLIANAYFVPSREMIEDLKNAARRGVRVVVLTNSPATNDISAVAAVSRYLFADLLAVNDEEAVRAQAGKGAGVAIHEWQGAPFDEGTLHAKFALADQSVAIVGSYNLDPRSERLNSETVLVWRDRTLAAQLARAFLDDDLAKSKRVTVDEATSYRKPGDLPKLFDLAFALPVKGWL